MPTTSPSARRNEPHSFPLFCSTALRDFRVRGLRHYSARRNPAASAIRSLLLRDVRWWSDRRRMGNVAVAPLITSKSSFPHKRIEDSRHGEAEPLVETYRTVVRLSDGQRQGVEVPSPKRKSTGGKKPFSYAMSAKFRQHADLGDMAHIMLYTRAQNDA